MHFGTRISPDKAVCYAVPRASSRGVISEKDTSFPLSTLRCPCNPFVGLTVSRRRRGACSRRDKRRGGHIELHFQPGQLGEKYSHVHRYRFLKATVRLVCFLPRIQTGSP